MVHHQENVTTPESLKRTIIRDFQTQRWFEFLISQPEVIKDLIDLDGVYKSLRRTLMIMQVLLAVLIGSFMLLFIFWMPYHMWVVIAGFLPLYKLHQMKAVYIAQISIALIHLEYDQTTLGQTTLYQITERLSEKYRTFSLVDAIYRMNDLCRKALVALVIIHAVLFFFLYQFSLAKTFLSAVIVYYFLYCILNLSFIYKNL